MAFLDEIVKYQRIRSAYLDFSQEHNPGIDPWLSPNRRLFGKTFDPRGPLPINGTVKQFGTLTRSVCNIDFAFESPSISPVLIDANNEWRALGAPPSHFLLYRWLLLGIRVTDDAGAIFDERIGVGQITQPTFPTSKSIQLGCQITPAVFLGTTLPRRLIGPAWPNAPADIKTKRVPIYYGKHGTPATTGPAVPAEEPEPEALMLSAGPATFSAPAVPTLLTATPTPLLVFSCLEQIAWQLVNGVDGTQQGGVPGTPWDFYQPGCFAMGRLANGKLWIATETFLWTMDPDFSNPNPDPTAYDDVGVDFGGAPFHFDLFSCGTNGTNLYIITSGPGPTFARLIEVEPVTWTDLREWPIASNYGFPNIAANPAATFAYYNDDVGGVNIKKLDLTTGTESTFLSHGGCGGLLCLSDGSVVVGWGDGVKRYNAAGTLLNTYPASAGTNQGSLSPGLPGRNSIWILGPATSGGNCHMYEIEVDTEEILVDFEMPDDGKAWNNAFTVTEGPTPTGPCVPTGSLVFSGYGNAPIRFASDTGVLLEPTYTPQIGDTVPTTFVWCRDIWAVDGGKVAAVGTFYDSPPTYPVSVVFEPDFSGYAAGGTQKYFYEVRSNYADKFYGAERIVTGGGPFFYHVVLHEFGLDGVLTGSSWALNAPSGSYDGLYGLSADGTKAIVLQLTPANLIVSVNLSTLVRTTLITPGGGEVFGGGFVQRNGDIITMGSGAAYFIRRYNSAGVLQHDYTLPADEPTFRIVPGPSDASFWRGIVTTGYSVRFEEYDTASGAILHSFTLTGSGTAGPSFFNYSGPFAALPQDIGECAEAPGPTGPCVPAETLAFSGYGDSAMKFLSPSGTAVDAPESAPWLGTATGSGGCRGIAALATGEVCAVGVNEPSPDFFSIETFDNQFVQVGGLLPPSNPGGIATNGTSRFYTILTGVSEYSIIGVDATGAQVFTHGLGATYFPTFMALGMRTESVAYLGGGASATVYKRDITGSVTTTFVTKTGYLVKVLLVLGTGDVVIGWSKPGSPGLIERYNSAGVLQQTTTLGVSHTPIWLTAGVDDTSFFASYYSSAATYSGITVATITTASGVKSNIFSPEDGSFEFDGPFTMLPVDIGDCDEEPEPEPEPEPDPDAEVELVCESVTPRQRGGACPTFLVETESLNDHGTLRPDPALPVVTSAFTTVIGGGDLTAPTWFYITALREGHESPVSGLLFASGSGIRVSWTPTPGGLDRPGDGYRIYCFDNPIFDPFSGTLGGATKVRTIFHSALDSIDGFNVDFLTYTRYYENIAHTAPRATRDFIPGETFTFNGPRFLVAGHACKEIRDVYALRPDPRAVQDAAAYQAFIDAHPDDFSDEQKTEARTLTSNAAKVVQVRQFEGTDYIVELVQSDDDCFETLVFDQSQTEPESCALYEITCNLHGIETNADRSGTLIETMGDMVDHLFLNWIWNSYRSSVGIHAPPGNKWFTNVPYAPGLWDSDSCQQAQLLSQDFIAGGYQGSGSLLEPIDVHQVVQDVMTSFGLDLYFDNNVGNGSFFVNLFDPDAVVRGTLPSLTPGNIFLKDGFSSFYDQETHANVIPYFAGPRVLVGYTWGGEVRDATSIGLYGVLVAKQPFNLDWTDHEATIADVLVRRRDLVKYPPILASALSHIGALRYPLTTVVKVTHPDGLSPTSTGWVNRVCRVFKSDINLDNLDITLLLRDVDNLVP